MRNPLFRGPREGSRPTLRERAASLRAAAARIIRGASAEPALPSLPVSSSPEPIQAAIERHRAAWFAFQAAPAGEGARTAGDEMDAALLDLLGTGCSTHADAVDLLAHLRWFLDTEGGNNPPDNFDWRFAQARAIDLALLLGLAADRPG